MSHRFAAEVGIITGDTERILPFYLDGLGFSVDRVLRFDQGTVHRLVRDDARCKLFQPVDGTELRAPAEPWSTHGGIAYAALHVDDVRGIVPSVTEAGGVVVIPVVDHRPGARFALVRDPDGNHWELLEEIPGDGR